LGGLFSLCNQRDHTGAIFQLCNAARRDRLMAMGMQFLIGSVPLAIVAGMTEDPGAIQWTFTFVAILLALSVFGSALV